MVRRKTLVIPPKTIVFGDALDWGVDKGFILGVCCLYRELFTVLHERSMMKFLIGQVEIRIYDLDLTKGHIRAAINAPIAGHEIIVAGEYDKSSVKPFYISVEVEKGGDKDNAEESTK